MQHIKQQTPPEKWTKKGEQVSGPDDFARNQLQIADKVRLWWNPASTEIDSLFDSSIELSESFFKEITECPVPVDARALWN